MKLDDEGMIRQLQDVAFSDGISEMIVLYKEGFLQDLHCILSTLRLVLPLYFEHFSESTLTKDIKELESVVT